MQRFNYPVTSTCTNMYKNKTLTYISCPKKQMSQINFEGYERKPVI